MSDLVKRLVRNPVGRFCHRALGPAVRLYRRITLRGLRPDHMFTTASFGDRSFRFEHRRWSMSDKMAIRQCFDEAQYELTSDQHRVLVDRMYHAIVSGGHTPLIVDCGANIGASVAWFSARYPQAHIVAIEPAPENCELLRRNTVGIDVDIREGGIAEREGTAFLVDTGGEMGFQLAASGSGQHIQTFSVRSLLASKPDSVYKPFLLKIDIEGGEKSLFSGDLDAIGSFPLIIMEPHDWLRPGESVSREFFRFHVEAVREIAVMNENVASLNLHSSVANGWYSAEASSR